MRIVPNTREPLRSLKFLAERNSASFTGRVTEWQFYALNAEQPSFCGHDQQPVKRYQKPGVRISGQSFQVLSIDSQ